MSLKIDFKAGFGLNDNGARYQIYQTLHLSLGIYSKVVVDNGAKCQLNSKNKVSQI